MKYVEIVKLWGVNSGMWELYVKAGRGILKSGKLDLGREKIIRGSKKAKVEL